MFNIYIYTATFFSRKKKFLKIDSGLLYLGIESWL